MRGMNARTALPFGAALLVAPPLLAQTPYRVPPKKVVQIVDAPPPPTVSISPRRDAMALVDGEANPPMTVIARSFHRLGGLRVDPDIGARRRTSRHTGLSVRRFADDAQPVRVVLPPGSRIALPSWSPDGERLAFTRDRDDGVELWVASAPGWKAAAVPGVVLNDVLGDPFDWAGDGVTVLARLVPASRGKPPAAPSVPDGPVVEETAGKVSKAATYQDLLRSAHDERLFEHFGATQLALVDVRGGGVRLVGKPGLYAGARLSPDGKHVLVTRLKRPFSYRVPYSYFARVVEVLDVATGLPRAIADLPVSDEVPTQGVPVGPRAVEWQALRPATLLWVEALDGGDPLKKVPHRDALFTLDAPFRAKPRELLKVQHRFTGLDFLARLGQALLSEHDRDRRWRTTALVDLSRPAETRKVLFDLSAKDAYGDPGRPLFDTRPDGQAVVLQDGDAIYLSGRGATPDGDRPFLDRMSLATLEKERLHRSDAASLESVISFAGESRTEVLVRHESKAEPPNYFVVDLRSGKRRTLTAFKDPAPQLTGVKKELLKYKRADGVPLSGMLYLPPGHKKGTRLPTLVWAYPLEYSDAATAGQVRASPNSFTFFRGATPLFFLTEGYAVLMDATMPVVGDPETMNDTFVQQITGAARAAVETLTELQVTDPARVLVAGHSYGAFMTANLLAHSDLFAAGIARSGAYNRSLTPFGFQSERRSFWEAPDLYMKVSPFTHATKIDEPLLLIHGEADNNQGTHTIQSERLYQAIRGGGGTARLVILPHESHGYVARESVLHTIAEMLGWADKHVKRRRIRRRCRRRAGARRRRMNG